MSKKAKIILAVVLLLAVVAAAVFAYCQWGPPAQKRAAEAQRAEQAAAETAAVPEGGPPAAEEGKVHITFEVVHGDGSKKEFAIATDAVTLREALEQEKLIEGTESEWGLYVLTVDGETADEAQQQWWCLTKDGEMSMTGVDDTVIADGDRFAFTLTTGWDAGDTAAEPEEGKIKITFVVVHSDGSEKEFVITTDAVTLREALEQEKLIEGTESEWGLYVLTVDGETADEAQQQWWCLTKDGEMSMTGVDDTVIADGDRYEFTFTVGW